MASPDNDPTLPEDDEPWMRGLAREELLCWSFLAQDDFLACERSWASTRMDPRDPRARAWALGPLAKLSDLEEFREARMFARMLIWERSYGKGAQHNPYAGAQGQAIERMFDEDFARKVGAARASKFESEAARDLAPLAQAFGHAAADPKALARMAKLRSYENIAPESASVSYIGALASRSLSLQEEELILRFLSPKARAAE